MIRQNAWGIGQGRGERSLEWLGARERLLGRLVVIALFAAGVLYALSLGETLRYPDEHEYYALATNLASGKGYSLDGRTPTTFRAPGYPLLLATVALVTPSVIAMRVLNMLALALTVLLLGQILRRHASPAAALIGTILAAGYPVALYTAGTLYPQIVSACLMLAMFAVAAAATRGWHLLVAGALAGYLILTVPTSIVAIGVLAAWLWWTRRRQRRSLVMFVIAALLVIAPWTVRNAVTFGSFVFVASNSGFNLLLGNSENTTPSAGINADISRYQAVGEQLAELERDAYYRDAALAYVRAHPTRSAALYVQKFANYFNIRNQLWTQSEASRLNDLLMLLTYGPFLVLTIVRIALLRVYPFSKIELLFVLVYIGNGLFSALFFTRIRFRVPFDFLIIGIVAMFAPKLLAAWHGWTTKPRPKA